MGLGSLALGGGYGPVGGTDAFGLIHKALDSGVTLIDTADFYGSGGVEQIIGRAIAGRGEGLIVSTRPGVQLGPGSLERACEASLRRLGVECIDLYYLQCQDPAAPVEEGMARLAELVRAGKIRHLGLTDGSVQQLRRAYAIHPVTALAVEFSLWGLRAESGLLSAADGLGVGIIASRPLGRGYLTGRIQTRDQLNLDDWRREDARFRPHSLRRSAEALRRLEATAAQLDLGASRLALGWLISQGPSIVPVPSTRDQVHLEMNLAASQVVLAPEIRDRLTGIFPPVARDHSILG